VTAARTGRAWRVAGACVPGVSHLRNGTPCQDAQYWREEADGALIAAVADGAGTAAHAEIGSAVAVRAAVEQAAALWWACRPERREDWSGLMRDVFEAARQAVVNAALERGLPLTDLSTTLLLAVAAPAWTAAAQVGDGAVVGRLRERALKPLTRPQATEYLNETTFLTSRNGLSSLQVAVREEPAAALALLTDGLQMLALKMPGGEPHPPFFMPLLRFTAATADAARAAELLRGFLQSPDVTRRADDDLTLLLAVRNKAR
jgi:hypothetical protein